MFERLLVAIDETDRSEVTLGFATSVAHEFRSAVHLLYVNEYLVGSRGIPVHTDEEAVSLVTEAMAQLRSEGITVNGSVRRARYRQVADRIASSAEEIAADAIILGSCRNRRLAVLRSRGVRERTLRRSPLPILTAPAPLGLPADAHLNLDDVMRVRRDEEQSLSA